MVGRTIGKYRIVEQIGRGGMGTVYKAIDETLDRRVAIKVLNADLIDSEAVERFRREAMTLAKLNHGRIGAIHELARDGHDLLMVMEFLEGDTFEKLIERGPLTISRAVTLCTQVLDALQYAHAAGVIHRDLKPANVIVTPSGDIKVMDFGIARVQGSEHLTTNGYMVGTPAYMAPEQVRGEEVDPRMDLYAVTVVLYRLLTQRLPFPGDTAIAMIHSQLNNPPTPPRQFRADLPEWLVTILDRGLSKAPADRFQTAAEFRTALEGGLTGKMRTPIELPGDTDETIWPMVTPPSMRIPLAPTATSPASLPSSTARSAESSSAALPSATPSSAVAPITPSAIAASGIAAGAVTATMPPLAATPTRPFNTEATVTLRAPHLATAGILLALLVVGVLVLAVVALRRPTTTVVAPAEVQTTAITPGATSTPVAPAATAADQGAGGAPASGAAPGISTSAAPTGTAASATTPGQPAATTQATPVVPPKPASGFSTAGAVAGATTPPSGASTGPTAAATSATGTGRAAGARGGTGVPAGGLGGAPAAGGTTAGRGATTAAPIPATSLEVAPTVPAAANAPAENFGDVKTLVVDGSKSREVDALLSLEPGNLVVRSREDGAVLRTMPYRLVGTATYARARRPRGQTNPGVVGVPENLGGSGFLGGARHWLTLQTPTEFLIVRLEDRNVMRVLNSIEARMGTKVIRSQGE